MKRSLSIPLAALVLLLAVLLFGTGLSRLEAGRKAQGKLQLEQVLRQTAAACYAAEGRYPPDVAYMQTHYGLQFSTEDYVIRYEIFASNLMPDITVLEK